MGEIVTNFRIGPQQMTVLTILAEMYGAPLDVVARMLGVSMPNTYRHVDRWRKAKLVSGLKVRPVPGPTWVFPTRSAVEALIGISPQYWTPTPKMAAHTQTVLEVRLALTGLDLERWICERRLRSEVGRVKVGQSRPHIHDGRYYDDQGRLWAVEVELTAKNAAAAKIAVAKAKQAAGKADCAGVLYFCRTPEIRNVITSAAHSTTDIAGPAIRVVDLNDVLGIKNRGASTTGRPGLTVLAGGASDHNNQADDGRDTGEAVS